MKREKNELVDQLRRELERRKHANEKYSLRTFAKDLGVSTTALSGVLAGKRVFSKKNHNSVIAMLDLSFAPADSKPDADYVRLMEDEFNLIADWHHIAILSLAKISSTRPEPEWIAKRLGIDEMTAYLALERLKRLNLISIHGKKLRRISQNISSPNDVVSSANARAHLQNMELAKGFVGKANLDLREFGATTMAIDPRKIPEAKKLMRKFRRDLSAFLEAGTVTEVYNLTLLLFPLTKKID